LEKRLGKIMERPLLWHADEDKESVEQDIRSLKAGYPIQHQNTTRAHEPSHGLCNHLNSGDGNQLYSIEPERQVPAGSAPTTPFTALLPALAQPELTDDPFTPALLSELCSVWFSKYHNWFPILHSPSLYDALPDLEALKAGALYIVFKAIVAVTVAGRQTNIHISNEQRSSISSHLRREVIIEAITNINIHSLQALLILAVLYHGEGNISEFWNLIALCKR